MFPSEIFMMVVLTTDGITPGRDLPQYQGHGVDIGLLE